MKSIYYDPATLQVHAELDSPNFIPVRNWEQKGYVHALVPEGIELTRDHAVQLDGRGVVIGSVNRRNPIQPSNPTELARISGMAKLYKIAGLTQAEIEAQEH